MSQIHFTIYCQFSPPSPPYNVHCSLPIVHSHGARYYQPNLSIWLSVDPMADKYPSMSPYTYCANNPVQLVDPDGRKIDPSSEKNWNNNKQEIIGKKTSIDAIIAKLYSLGEQNFQWKNTLFAFSHY